MNALERMKEKYHAMSGAEKRIADVILENPGLAVNMTVKYLAWKAGVSDGSVINFAGSLGYGGFTKLKIALAMCAEEFRGCAFESVYSCDSAAAALQKMSENASKTFADTCTRISPDALEKAVGLLLKAQRIEVYGMGGSGFIAGDAAYRLMRIGLNAAAFSDPIIGAISASRLGREDAMIVISHSGRTTGMLRALQIGKERGAGTIAVTSYGESPIAKLCDAALVVSSEEAVYHREAVVARLAQLLIVDTLCACIGSQRGEEAMEHMDEALGFIAEHGTRDE